MIRKEIDPKGLIRESYLIKDIHVAECRSIFMDWVLSLPKAMDVAAISDQLWCYYSPKNPDHPMTELLHQAMVVSQKPVRRGGRQARL